MELQQLSAAFQVRAITEEDLEEVYRLCLGNPRYYQYCPPAVSHESLRADLVALPPGIAESAKHYLGFYSSGRLIAVMDLVEGYPEKDVAYIGFFMTDPSVQNQGTGSAIIEELCKNLKKMGFGRVQLAWVKGNGQAEHFWRKNHFTVMGERPSRAAAAVVAAERLL